MTAAGATVTARSPARQSPRMGTENADRPRCLPVDEAILLPYLKEDLLELSALVRLQAEPHLRRAGN